MAVERLRTYIEGFDENISGGIPKNSIVLFAGTPGTMKTSVVYNLMYNNAKEHGIRGLYITLEQTRESLLQHMEGLGYEQLPENQLSVVDFATIRLKYKTDFGREIGQLDDAAKWLEDIETFLEQHVKMHKCEIVALDSLSALYSLYSINELSNMRKDLFYFFGFIRDLGATTLLISEMSPDSKKFGEFSEDFLADGIIHLKLANIDEVESQLRIRVAKMRSTEHSRSYYQLMSEKGELKTTQIIID